MAAASVGNEFSQLHCMKSGVSYSLDHSPFRIGRDRHADIICTALSASRNHCELRTDDNRGWVVLDKGSSGTFINKKLLKPGIDYILNDGDVLHVGNPEDKLSWKFKSNKTDVHSKEEEELRLEVQRLRQALDNEQKRCEQELRQQKDALLNALKAKELELEEVKKQAVSTEGSIIPDLEEKEAERETLHILLAELNENLEKTIAQGIREKELAEQRFREQQQQLLQLNQAKQQIEGDLCEEQRKKQEAEEKLKELATVVAQQSTSAEGAVSVNQVEEILESELQCGICSELFITAMTLNCTHTFCRLCLKQWKRKVCPLCRARITSQNRALVLDNYIQKMVDSLSEEFRKRRQAIVEERKNAEERPSQGAYRNRGGSSNRGARVRVAVMRNGGSVGLSANAVSASIPAQAPQPTIPQRFLNVVRLDTMSMSTLPVPERFQGERLPVLRYRGISVPPGSYEVINLDGSMDS